MRGTHTLLPGSQTAIREVRTVEGPAVQRRVASAMSLSETVGRLTRERVPS